MLYVVSNSTKKYVPSKDSFWVVEGITTKDLVNKVENTEDEVIAIGGGAVIDYAKMMCKNPILCYPTTAAGSARTSHSVYWDEGTKLSLEVPKPKQVIIEPRYLKGLHQNTIENTTYDLISHILESMWSKKSTDESGEYVAQSLDYFKEGGLVNLIKAGNLAGKAIELTGTNIIHSLSYPMTGYYGISHGESLGFLLPKIAPFFGFKLSKLINIPQKNLNINIEFIINEALKYDKIHDVNKEIDKNILMRLLN